jgi:hypothetical protein
LDITWSCLFCGELFGVIVVVVLLLGGERGLLLAALLLLLALRQPAPQWLEEAGSHVVDAHLGA